MMIVGCDFHPSWEQVAWLDTETGETGEQKLVHAPEQAQEFYRRLPVPSLIGLEATGNCHWLQDLLQELGHPAAGGTNALDNLVMTCLGCNSRKHQRPVGDFSGRKVRPRKIE